MRLLKGSAEQKQDPVVQVIIQALSTIEGCPLSLPWRLTPLRIIASWFSLSQRRIRGNWPAVPDLRSLSNEMKAQRPRDMFYSNLIHLSFHCPTRSARHPKKTPQAFSRNGRTLSTCRTALPSLGLDSKMTSEFKVYLQTKFNLLTSYTLDSLSRRLPDENAPNLGQEPSN